jgi:hypothetical protein
LRRINEGFEPRAKLPPERNRMVRRGVGRSSLREAIRGLRATGVIEVSLGEGICESHGGTSILIQPRPPGLRDRVGLDASPEIGGCAS